MSKKRNYVKNLDLKFYIIQNEKTQLEDIKQIVYLKVFTQTKTYSLIKQNY